MPDPTPTDAEALALCRARLHAVEKAVLDYLDAVEATGKERQAACERVGQAIAAHEPGELVARHMAHFYHIYSATLPARRAAAEALLAALQTDWRTAIVCAGDMSEEDRAAWLSKGEADQQP